LQSLPWIFYSFGTYKEIQKHILRSFTIRLLHSYNTLQEVYFNPALGQHCRLGGRRAPLRAGPTTPHEGGLKSTKRLRHKQEPAYFISIDDSVLRLNFGYQAQISDFNQYASRHSGEGQPKINLSRLSGTLTSADDWILSRPLPARYR